MSLRAHLALGFYEVERFIALAKKLQLILSLPIDW